MCGIVGLYLKNEVLEAQLGELFTPMLIAMSNRGPDSAGFAIYGDEVADEEVKLTLLQKGLSYEWNKLVTQLEQELQAKINWFQNANVAVLKFEASAKLATNAVKKLAPEILILSVGKSIEILKGVGMPRDIVNTFNVASMQGSHIIGHTRMATESAVTMEGSHPFSTGEDLCLVHNGSLSNHNRLRAWLKRKGIEFETENDSEVAAGFLTYRLQQGDSLREEKKKALTELDGFYTFAVGTREGFAVLRDPIACKPAVLAETEDYVAMASEYQALSTLPGIDCAKVWEPEPETLYVWQRSA